MHTDEMHKVFEESWTHVQYEYDPYLAPIIDKKYLYE